MSSKITGDNNNQVNFQFTEENGINGFTLENNKATKEIIVEGKKLLLTINFPAKLNQKQMESRLREFNGEKVQAAGLLALSVGLGPKVKAVLFTEGRSGKIERVQTQYGTKVQEIKLSELKKAYAEKPDDPMISKQIEMFEKVNKLWSSSQSQETEKEEEIKPEKEKSRLKKLTDKMKKNEVDLNDLSDSDKKEKIKEEKIPHFKDTTELPT